MRCTQTHKQVIRYHPNYKPFKLLVLFYPSRCCCVMDIRSLVRLQFIWTMITNKTEIEQKRVHIIFEAYKNSTFLLKLGSALYSNNSWKSSRADGTVCPLIPGPHINHIQSTPQTQPTLSYITLWLAGKHGSWQGNTPSPLSDTQTQCSLLTWKSNAFTFYLFCLGLV
jgi:hypothetical protein